MIEVGDLATWFQGVTSAGALIAAGYAAKASFGVLKIENERDQERLLREEQAQADHVAAWLTLIRTEGWMVRVANRSSLPVYKVRVSIFDEDGVVLGEPGYRDVVAPGEAVLQMPRYADDSIDDPESFYTMDAHGNRVWRREPPKVRVALHFCDAGGRNWTRDRHGSLTRDWDMDEMPPRPVSDDLGNRLDDDSAR